MVMVIMGIMVIMVIMVILVGNQGASDWGALQGCPTRTGGENLLDWIGTSRWDLVKCFPFDLPGILDTLFSSFWISLEFPDEIFSNVFLSCLLSLLSRDCRVCCSKPTKIWIMWTRWRIWSPAAPTPTPPLKVPSPSPWRHLLCWRLFLLLLCAICQKYKTLSRFPCSCRVHWVGRVQNAWLGKGASQLSSFECCSQKAPYISFKLWYTFFKFLCAHAIYV